MSRTRWAIRISPLHCNASPSVPRSTDSKDKAHRIMHRPSPQHHPSTWVCNNNNTSKCNRRTQHSCRTIRSKSLSNSERLSRCNSFSRLSHFLRTRRWCFEIPFCMISIGNEIYLVFWFCFVVASFHGCTHWHLIV